MNNKIRIRNIPVSAGDHFVVTGTRPDGTRFPSMRFDSLGQAVQINLWRGHIWLEQNSGKRTLLHSVYN